jgi:hypothetical protein
MLVYFWAIWYNLTILYNVWPSGVVCGHLVYFFPFWLVWTKTDLATLGWATFLVSFGQTHLVSLTSVSNLKVDTFVDILTVSNLDVDTALYITFASGTE